MRANRIGFTVSPDELRERLVSASERALDTGRFAGGGVVVESVPAQQRAGAKAVRSHRRPGSLA